MNMIRMVLRWLKIREVFELEFETEAVSTDIVER